MKAKKRRLGGKMRNNRHPDDTRTRSGNDPEVPNGKVGEAEEGARRPVGHLPKTTIAMVPDLAKVVAEGDLAMVEEGGEETMVAVTTVADAEAQEETMADETAVVEETPVDTMIPVQEEAVVVARKACVDLLLHETTVRHLAVAVAVAAVHPEVEAHGAVGRRTVDQGTDVTRTATHQ